jgi:hypothetical protein
VLHLTKRSRITTGWLRLRVRVAPCRGWPPTRGVEDSAPATPATPGLTLVCGAPSPSVEDSAPATPGFALISAGPGRRRLRPSHSSHPGVVLISAGPGRRRLRSRHLGGCSDIRGTGASKTPPRPPAHILRHAGHHVGMTCTPSHPGVCSDICRTGASKTPPQPPRAASISGSDSQPIPWRSHRSSPPADVTNCSSSDISAQTFGSECTPIDRAAEVGLPGCAGRLIRRPP